MTKIIGLGEFLAIVKETPLLFFKEENGWKYFLTNTFIYKIKNITTHPMAFALKRYEYEQYRYEYKRAA